MALFWQIVTLLSVWLLYGLAASFFVRNVNRRDYLLLICSGLIGGLLGGRIGNILDVDIKVAGLASTYDLLNYNILLFDKSGLLLLNEKLSS